MFLLADRSQTHDQCCEIQGEVLEFSEEHMEMSWLFSLKPDETPLTNTRNTVPWTMLEGFSMDLL